MCVLTHHTDHPYVLPLKEAWNTGPRVTLQLLGQLHDVLHHDGLVSHSLHQGGFLQASTGPVRMEGRRWQRHRPTPTDTHAQHARTHARTHTHKLRTNLLHLQVDTPQGKIATGVITGQVGMVTKIVTTNWKTVGPSNV